MARWFSREAGAGFHIGIKETAVFQEEPTSVRTAGEVKASFLMAGCINGELELCNFPPLVIRAVDPLIRVVGAAA